jgi:hypothetical protein
MQARYEYFQNIAHAVDDAIRIIGDVKAADCYKVDFLEHELIPALGLNNELLKEQPPELEAYFGKGLHLWQYPSQLSRYLVWLTYNARDIRSYMEIGCRWGGTFILVTEWLKKVGAKLDFAIAVDPIEPTPFIKRYIELSQTPVVYLKTLSTSPEFMASFAHARPEFVFIDGDHTMRGVMIDHLTARRSARIIAHHDVSSRACPDTTLFWSYAKAAETEFEAAEFMQQYASVGASYLGIGVMKRKA